MKKICILILGLQFLFSCSQKEQEKKEEWVSQEIQNPILQGFYPDPSICRVGDDYYLVNSTFSYFPGLPVFHSKDLVHWEQLGNAMDRLDQFDLEGLGVSHGLFAPSIRFHKGLYYITCTVVGPNTYNFIITAKDPKGPWSTPVKVPEAHGIDPSMFFDKNGKAYFVYHSIPEKRLYEGHCVIRLLEIDLETLKVKGEPKLLVDGGSDITKQPKWLEGPHIYQERGYYYLMAAEGGTEDQHCEVIFRSKNVDGPYESFEGNPILTQRHLDPNRENPISSTGHADLIQAPDGSYWGVFLGCRPYDNEDHYNTGRETFLAPVKWENDWPIFDLDGGAVKRTYTMNVKKTEGEALKPLSPTRFDVHEDFTASELADLYLFLRTPKVKFHEIKDGALEMELQETTCQEKSSPSFIGVRQQHIRSEFSTKMRFKANKETEKAGLIAFQNDQYFYYICQSVENGKDVVQVYKSVGSEMELVASEVMASSEKVELKIESDEKEYTFYYKLANEDWTQIGTGLDAKHLSKKVAGGFVGTIYAMYATSQNTETTNKVFFDALDYQGKDVIVQ